MIRPRILCVTAALAWCVASSASAVADGGAPEFKEVYDVLRAHLAGTSEADLNRAAVQGLISALAPRVSLLTNGESVQGAQGPLISKSNLFDGDLIYLRMGHIDQGSAKALREAYDRVSGTNRVKGLVIDLRFARGNDYESAADVADLFLAKAQPLLAWDKDMLRSKEKTNAITIPVAALVNSQTTGAAEALAAVLRQTGAALLLGGKTAGRAMVSQDFKLSTGQQLRIATGPITLGDGSAVPSSGVKPDIAVDVSPEDERAYFADAFVTPRTNLVAGMSISMTNQPGGTNRSRRMRFGEAELVRERREGLSSEDLMGGRDTPEKPVVQDPVLARALDVLKGLAVVRRSRP